jgi:hypothetical protein
MMKKTPIKLICNLSLLLCFSFSVKAQLPIKNSALAGEWKLISLNGEYDTYSYDCEKKDFFLSTDLFLSLGEAKADIFEKETIKDAEKSFFKINTNGKYELALGFGSIEKGTWKSTALEGSEEGFIPDRFGYLNLTRDGEDFDIILINIHGQQLFLSVITESGGGLSQKYIFRKDFKGSAFK